MKPYIALLAVAALAPQAWAQQKSGRPHPADPAAQVPAVKYESALTSYRGFREEPLAPWREVNDEVARVGGHVGVVRGARGQAASSGGGAAKSSAPPARTAPGASRK